MNELLTGADIYGKNWSKNTHFSNKVSKKLTFYTHFLSKSYSFVGSTITKVSQK